MISQPAINDNAGISIDPKQIEALRQSAKQNSPEALKAVAQQFEGLFMNMMMKSMREATPKDGLLDNEQGKMFTSMLDQQMSQNFAKRGVGLADVLIRQLSPKQGLPAPDAAGAAGAAGANTATGATGGATVDPALPGKPRAASLSQAASFESGFKENLQTALESGIPGVLKAVLSGVRNTALAGASGLPAAPADRPRGAQSAHVRAFEDKLSAHAEEAARTTGIPAKFMLGQAALESGWGKREILTADGSSSHNVFGIKAGAGWKGKVVETATTEYVHGVPERKVERFRAYDSYADAFRDYASTLQKNPRYQAVLSNAKDVLGFAQGLQRAGYATDPHYADKLARIINHTLSA
ncbi:MAG: flagellar assembly peptidoglycan hydrolase FlgJ [Herminiimonas sp.]|nr:flagellar assembly peptidoglycan hydrolase FlgJ [Herminiimonas sp.]